MASSPRRRPNEDGADPASLPARLVWENPAYLRVLSVQILKSISGANVPGRSLTDIPASSPPDVVTYNTARTVGRHPLPMPRSMRAEHDDEEGLWADFEKALDVVPGCSRSDARLMWRPWRTDTEVDKFGRLAPGGSVPNRGASHLRSGAGRSPSRRVHDFPVSREPVYRPPDDFLLEFVPQLSCDEITDSVSGPVDQKVFDGLAGGADFIREENGHAGITWIAECLGGRPVFPVDRFDPVWILDRTEGTALVRYRLRRFGGVWQRRIANLFSRSSSDEIEEPLDRFG